MRLFEAILEANHRAVGGDKSAGLHPDEYADALPVIALSCIDPRLNPLLPETLGLPEEQFIWLRNAGNIITSTTSSTMRSLALACAVKGGKEIAILGHTDCKVGRCSALELTDRFKALGIDRGRLPENLVEFFGMFASERQNVLRGVDLVRQSPLIGSKIPVHGLLVDIQTGKLEWLVNGYQTLATAMSNVAITAQKLAPDQEIGSTITSFQMGGMKFPESKIGDSATKPVPGAAPIRMEPVETITPKVEVKAQAQTPAQPRFDKAAMYKVLGDDRKVYGPVTGAEIERWIDEGRIDLRTLAQKIGYKEWKQLEAYLLEQVPPEVPIPPALNTALKMIKGIKDLKDKNPWR